jgi:hypothetical protein
LTFIFTVLVRHAKDSICRFYYSSIRKQALPQILKLLTLPEVDKHETAVSQNSKMEGNGAEVSDHNIESGSDGHSDEDDGDGNSDNEDNAYQKTSSSEKNGYEDCVKMRSDEHRRSSTKVTTSSSISPRDLVMKGSNKRKTIKLYVVYDRYCEESLVEDTSAIYSQNTESQASDDSELTQLSGNNIFNLEDSMFTPTNKEFEGSTEITATEIVDLLPTTVVWAEDEIYQFLCNLLNLLKKKGYRLIRAVRKIGYSTESFSKFKNRPSTYLVEPITEYVVCKLRYQVFSKSLNIGKLCEKIVHIWLKLHRKHLVKEFFMLSGDKDKMLYYNILSYVIWFKKDKVLALLKPTFNQSELENELNSVDLSQPYSATEQLVQLSQAFINEEHKAVSDMEKEDLSFKSNGIIALAVSKHLQHVHSTSNNKHLHVVIIGCKGGAANTLNMTRCISDAVSYYATYDDVSVDFTIIDKCKSICDSLNTLGCYDGAVTVRHANFMTMASDDIISKADVYFTLISGKANKLFCLKLLGLWKPTKLIACLRPVVDLMNIMNTMKAVEVKINFKLCTRLEVRQTPQSDYNWNLYTSNALDSSCGEIIPNAVSELLSAECAEVLNSKFFTKNIKKKVPSRSEILHLFGHVNNTGTIPLKIEAPLDLALNFEIFPNIDDYTHFSVDIKEFLLVNIVSIIYLCYFTITIIIRHAVWDRFTCYTATEFGTLLSV